jgi:hypothetical protein
MTSSNYELDAVNRMLSAIGEAPVNSLLNSGLVDVTLARSVLSEVSLDVQTQGWHFNTERGITLSVDSHGKIPIPPNTLRVDTVGDSVNTDVVERGGYLYDIRNHTFEFEDGVTADLVTHLEYNDLPQVARYYIGIRAARIFQDRSLGSDTMYRINKQDEIEALATLKAADADTADYNILTDNIATARVLYRRGRI